MAENSDLTRPPLQCRQILTAWHASHSVAQWGKRPDLFWRSQEKRQGQEPFRIITDKLKTYSAALRTILCDVAHNRERSRRSLASTDPPRGTADAPIQVCWPRPTVLFLYGLVQNLFRVGRHLLRSTNHRLWRSRSFQVWRTVTAARGDSWTSDHYNQNDSFPPNLTSLWHHSRMLASLVQRTPYIGSDASYPIAAFSVNP